MRRIGGGATLSLDGVPDKEGVNIQKSWCDSGE